MNRLHATKDFWLAALRADSPALQDAVVQAGPGVAVPGCPDWTVADLVQHLTSELHWVRETTARGVTDRPAEAPVVTPQPDWDAALDGLRRELTGTIETLEALDADFPAWNWAPQAKKVSFWQRRMAHEISVHRWDAESAAERATPIETKLAADGVGEVLDTWLPAGRRKGPTDLHGVVHLAASDAGYEWFVRLRGAGVALLDTGTILDSDDHHARAQATGTASDLLLMLMGRIPADRLVVTGDPRLVTALRTG
ncbi:maleylpyruvate isomerase family mycothiol-dependent enzyme [Actinoplanes solisilvae]|uniref:maleylpyruvate isomerase family mycothiol-dependent enzyme n=1 Tax=Actinoplanes solisilvae TaxID=2486853 RepID=UPI000FDCC022|nr:maleylpyruvate isomerase family mycothiol-dependent enzyme [Actinoplanes solisilvae]